MEYGARSAAGLARGIATTGPAHTEEQALSTPAPCMTWLEAQACGSARKRRTLRALASILR